MEVINQNEIKITPGQQQSFQKTIKINNFKKFINSGEEFQSKYIEVFPGKKIAFCVKSEYIFPTEYALQDADWTATSNNDKFFSLWLKSEKYYHTITRRFKLAGTVEITVGDSSQTFKFGDRRRNTGILGTIRSDSST